MYVCVCVCGLVVTVVFVFCFFCFVVVCFVLFFQIQEETFHFQGIGKCYQLRVLDVAANELRIFPTEVLYPAKHEA